MSSNIFASEIFTVIQKTLDAAALQHEVISNNIANVNTPYFKRSEVEFRDELAAALLRPPAAAPPMGLTVTQPGHIQVDVGQRIAGSVESIKPKVLVREDTTLRNDGNNVDIDVEMAKLAQNTLLYNAFAQLASLKLAGLRNVIREGR